MKYSMIFHANLNYAYLPEHQYEFVIRNAYEMIIDTMRDLFPDEKYVFEASGFTIEHMAEKTPDVMEKLRDAITRGQCEFMGSPYAHPMLPNFDKEDGIWSLRFARDVYRKHLAMEPVSFWNPECGWRDYVPQQVKEAGYAHMIGDFEAYSRSLGADNKPLRPEIYKLEHSDDPSFYSFEFKYDLPGDDEALHYPFDDVYGLNKGDLRVMLRSDRIAQFGVRHFMGMEGYSYEKYMETIKRYGKDKEGKEEEGTLIIFADDAEYIGTNGWFRLKYQNRPDDVFQHTPESRDKLIELVKGVKGLGDFVTFDDACQAIPLQQQLKFDNDSAWHGARASTWAGTPMARLLRPWQKKIRDALKDSNLTGQMEEKAWYHLTNSYNSDGQWPPTLKDAPHIVHPYNYTYCFENLLQVENLVGGIDRAQLDTDPVKTLEEILCLQLALIEKKAKNLLESQPESDSGKNAVFALQLVEKARDFSSVSESGEPVLYPSEYTVRVDNLVQARRLVGGVEIENVDDSSTYEVE